MTHGLFEGILVLLLASVVLVWLFQHLRLSPILGYLLAGVLVGPHGFGLIAQSEDIRVLADLGLVFLMFTVGLEFSLPQLLAARATVLGLGAGQVALTTAVFGLLAWLLGMEPAAALIAGGALAMSSTALVVKQLGEQRELDTQHGHAGVGVLLFQDLAVIPFLIVIPILAGQAETHPAWALTVAVAQGVGVFLVLYLSGRWSLRPLFARIAAIRSRELFMLTVLLVSLGAAWLSNLAGLSEAMGAFLAGILIGETEFKRQVEADIRPFQDALVGLFFISMGMLLDLRVLPEIWIHVLVATALLMVLKGVVVTGLATMLRMPWSSALRAGIVLAQGGEFGLVLVSIALGLALLPPAGGQIALTTITLSMALSPILIRFNKALAQRLYRTRQAQEGLGETRAEPREGLEGHAILCGYGRVGQAIARILEITGYPYHALDTDARRVRTAQDAGEPVSYGDATHRRLLESVGLASARALVVTFRNMDAALSVLDHARTVQPGLPILIRASEDADLDQLLDAGAAEVIQETLESSLTLAAHLLLHLGAPAGTVLDTVREVRENRYRPLRGFIPDQMPFGREGSARYLQYLHAVPLDANARVIGRTLADIGLDRWGVQVSALRRRGIRVAEPTPGTRLQEGDVLILSGTKQALKRAESFLHKRHRMRRQPVR